MQMDANIPPGEMLRRTMRHWLTGVAIVTSRVGEVTHGMTVNSFVSISLDPPVVTVTMNNDTRTCHLVRESGIFAVTILSQPQVGLAERFAGRMETGVDRMVGVDTFPMVTGAPLIRGGLGFVDCRVIYQYALPLSTLFLGEVVAAHTNPPHPDEADPAPLVYYNRTFTHLIS